jgi:hypothetical protein
MQHSNSLTISDLQFPCRQGASRPQTDYLLRTNALDFWNLSVLHVLQQDPTAAAAQQLPAQAAAGVHAGL